MLDLIRMRRLLALRGVAPATTVPEGSGGRTEEATILPARLVEDAELTHHGVGDPEAWSETVAFLDGTQRSWVAGYAGTAPIVVAEVAAAVRERAERRLRTVVEERRALAIGRAHALDQAGDALEGCERVVLDDDGPAHPARDLGLAARKLDQRRGNLELELGDRYRRGSPAWIVVDGSLAASPTWAADGRMVGVSKSHATLPFGGAELERYLRLPAAQRSSIFTPQSPGFAPVHAWALRLWPWEGRDLFHGLVRIEVSPAQGTPDLADWLSRRLLAERAPISTPDPRWDRLLYGIHAVEQYLKAGGSR